MDDEETRKDVRKSEEQGGPSLVEEQDEPSFVGPVFGKICGDSNDNEQVPLIPTMAFFFFSEAR